MNDKTFRIHRPLVFLCGPKYDGSNPNDRRKVLFDYIRQIREVTLINGKRVVFSPIPVIVDEIFGDDTAIKRTDLKLVLLEEIVAAISYKTYIFLDSLSTSFEYGLFDNSINKNNSVIFLEKDYDKRKQRTIGEYLQKNIPNNNLVVYEHDSESDDYSKNEFIGFKTTKNGEAIIPPTIKQRINDDFQKIKEKVLKGFTIKFANQQEQSVERVKVVYSLSEDCHQIRFNISVRLAFYLSVMALSNPNIEKMINTNDFEKGFLLFKNYVFNLFLESCMNSNDIDVASLMIHKPEIEIKIGEYSEAFYLFKHFVFINNKITSLLKKPFKNAVTSLRTNREITPSFKGFKEFNFINSLFKIHTIEEKLVNDYNDNPNDYIEEKIIKISGKRRKIIQYKNTHKGRHLMRLHKRVSDILSSLFQPSKYAYAYKKKTSIKMCVEQHIGSKHFIKLDVHSFFNSIKSQVMCGALRRRIIKMLQYERLYCPLAPKQDDINNVLKCCFYKNHLPLGFITSPILSDIYMNEFDNQIGKSFSHIVFTRYADDILISSKNETKHLSKCKEEIIQQLSLLKLSTNNEKKLEISLKNNGDSIKFLGINIVKRNYENELTISKSHLMSYAKRIYKEKHKENPDMTIVTGIINYVQSISQKSFQNLNKTYLAMFKETI